MDDSVLNIKNNIGVSEKTHLLIRLLNRISKTRKNPSGLIRRNPYFIIRRAEEKINVLLRKSGKIKTIPDEIIEYCSIYISSNNRLQNLVNSVDLKSLGYPI